MPSIQNQTNTRKNILFVTRPLSPPWDEASKNFAYDLACNIDNHNITILVDKYIDDAPKHITQKKIYTSNQLSLSQKIKLIQYLHKNANNFDIIHLLFTPTKLNSKIMKIILKNTKAQIVQTIATLRDDLYSTSNLKKMFFADTLITYSKWAQNKLENLGFDNITQIYPGFNLSKFTPSQKDPKLTRKWKISDNNFIVTYPGEFTRLGATDLIVDTFIELWKNPDNTDIKYLCACRIKNDADAKKKQEVITKVTKAGHIDKISFTDTFPDVNAIYNISDIIIFPVTNMSGKFDVPLAMIEPYACKKPVIASNLKLFKEFSSDKINVIIPKENKEALANAILNLRQNSDKRKQIGKNAFTFAHETFNIQKIASQYTNIYNSM